jgi:crotonobetainyl-CoA:carnitine CoA-transferase CaiB-like acyl-CoA transferase
MLRQQNLPMARSLGISPITSRGRSADALDALRAAGMPAIPVHRFDVLFDDPQIIANELLLELGHPTWERLTAKRHPRQALRDAGKDRSRRADAR